MHTATDSQPHTRSHTHTPTYLRLWALLLAAVIILLTPAARTCTAHPATIAAATAKVQPDGHFQVQMRFDILAFALDDTPARIGDGPMNDLLDGPGAALQSQLAEAAARFRRNFKVSGGTGPGAVDALQFPTAADVQKWRDSDIKPRLPVMMTVTAEGHLPPGAPTVSFRFPDVLGQIVLTTEFPYQEPVSEPVDAGAFSNPLPMPALHPAPAAVASTQPVRPAPVPAVPPLQAPTPAPSRAPRQPMSPSIGILPVAPTTRMVALPTLRVTPAPAPVQVPRAAAPPVPPTSGAAAPTRTPQPSHPAAVRQRPPSVVISHPVPWPILVFRYIKMGFNHILPEGLDHILFVLGLFLLSTRLKTLLWQITAFTVAHSLTLALALYGIVRLPSSIIEPIIAASIAFVAIENLFTTELKPWRPFVVFGFGLVHGMGFAGALKDLGLQRHDFLTALVGFNIGVELGQLSVVLGALLLVGWFRSRPDYRKIVVIPGSLVIAVVAVFWTVQRILL